MILYHPTQYDYDKLTSKDFIYIINRKSFLYTFIRKYFMPNKLKIKIFNKEGKRIEVYSEDCIIVPAEDVAKYAEQQNVIITSVQDNKIKTQLSDKVYITSTNLCFNLNDVRYEIPIQVVLQLISKQTQSYNIFEQSELIDESKKYNKYQPNYFKRKIKEKNIKEWTYSYCSICGSPTKMIFEEDKILLKTDCTCGNVILDHDMITYQHLSDWYNSRTNRIIVEQYKKFWD